MNRIAGPNGQAAAVRRSVRGVGTWRVGNHRRRTRKTTIKLAGDPRCRGADADDGRSQIVDQDLHLAQSEIDEIDPVPGVGDHARHARRVVASNRRVVEPLVARGRSGPKPAVPM